MTISISKDVLAQELDGETVLLDMGSERFFGLDVMSTRVWQLLQKGADEVRIVDTLLEEYEVEREVLERDIAALLQHLADAGLVSLG